MNKKIFSMAILSILVLTISVVAVNEIALKEPAAVSPAPPPETQKFVNPDGSRLNSYPSNAFHETQFTYNTTTVYATGSGVTLMTQSVYIPTGGAEFTATFSAETDTAENQDLRIQILDNGALITPGTIVFDKNSGEDGWGSHSFTWGKVITTTGWHTITVKAIGSGKIWYKSLETEIEEW